MYELRCLRVAEACCSYLLLDRFVDRGGFLIKGLSYDHAAILTFSTAGVDTIWALDILCSTSRCSYLEKSLILVNLCQITSPLHHYHPILAFIGFIHQIAFRMYGRWKRDCDRVVLTLVGTAANSRFLQTQKAPFMLLAGTSSLLPIC